MVVCASAWYKRDAPENVKTRVAFASSERLYEISQADVLKMVAHQPKANKLIVGAVTKHDITRALEPRKTLSYEETKQILPEEIRIYTSLFLDDKLQSSSALPPHRPGVDTKIKLVKDDQGKESEVPWSLLYEMSRDELLVLRKTLADLFDKNWIRASSSPGGAPGLFIKKPGGGLRFCVEYRALNTFTERDRYPLPLIKEILQTLTDSKWLSKVDVRLAFYLLRISEVDEWKTAFRTRFGSYEWIVTLFRLLGAPSAFQIWINQELSDLLGTTCSAYVDHVVIFSNRDLTDH